MTSEDWHIIASETRSQLWRYAIVGVANTFVGLFIIVSLHKGLGLGIVLSNAVGYGAGLLLSFSLNRSWTFKFNGRRDTAMLLFALLVVTAFLLNLAIINSLLGLGAGYFPAQTAGVIAYSALMFIGMKRVVFKQSN